MNQQVRKRKLLTGVLCAIAAASGLWGFLVVRESDVLSAGKLLVIALRKENQTHDWFEKQYSRLPPPILDRLPFRLHPWEVERAWAIEQLKTLTNESAVIVPRLLEALRSGQLSPDEIELFTAVIVHHPQMAEMSLPVLLSQAATNRESGTTQASPVAQLAPGHPEVFQVISNQLVQIPLEPVNAATSHVDQTRFDNWRRNVLLSFARLEGHTVERSNLLERLLRDAHGPCRAELVSAYRHYRFPHPEQAWVLDRLSRDEDDWIQNTALEGLTYHSRADEVSLQIAVMRLDETLYDDAAPPRLRAVAADAAGWLHGEMGRVAPAVAYWLRTEDDFAGQGIAHIVGNFTSEGIALPGVTERLVQAIGNPQSPQLAEHCLAWWYCTLETSETLTRLVAALSTSDGDDSLAVATALGVILDAANQPDGSFHSDVNFLTAKGRETAQTRRHAVLKFLEDKSRLVPFLTSLKGALDKQPPDFHRVAGPGLRRFVRHHETEIP